MKSAPLYSIAQDAWEKARDAAYKRGQLRGTVIGVLVALVGVLICLSLMRWGLGLRFACEIVPL
jgi:hypothetical protein